MIVAALARLLSALPVITAVACLTPQVERVDGDISLPPTEASVAQAQELV